MIDHIWSDGSIGHEYEIGDRVVVMKEELSLGGTALGYVGLEGLVVAVDGYGRSSSYHTSFPFVRLDNGGSARNLSCNFSPAPGQEPRLLIIESTVEDQE